MACCGAGAALFPVEHEEVGRFPGDAVRRVAISCHILRHFVLGIASLREGSMDD